MHFRIGVNLGDVVVDEDRIYGDGVNIASRVESLCDGGGVCISGTAFEHVENKLDLLFDVIDADESGYVFSNTINLFVSSILHLRLQKVYPISY